MGRGVHTTAAQKDVILKLKSEGLSMRQIAKTMDCSKNKVLTLFTPPKPSKPEAESVKRQRVLTNF